MYVTAISNSTQRKTKLLKGFHLKLPSIFYHNGDIWVYLDFYCNSFNYIVPKFNI